MIVFGCITKKHSQEFQQPFSLYVPLTSLRTIWGNNLRKRFHKLVNAVWKKQLTLNSTVSTLLLKRELAPSAVNHPSTEEFASLEDVIPNNFFPRSGKFFDWKSSFRKLACKFAFFLHFLNTMFIVLIPAFSLPSLCEMGAHCIVYPRQEQIAFISSLNTLWFKVAWLLIRDERLWRDEQRRNTCSRFGLLFSFWLLLAVFKLQVVMWESSTAMSVGLFHIC